MYLPVFVFVTKYTITIRTTIAKINGIGNTPIFPLPRKKIASGIFVTAFPFVITNVIPPYNDCIPIVVTIEFRRSFVTRSPLITPNKIPDKSPIAKAKNGFIFMLVIKIPPSTPDNVAIFPTERSSSPISRSRD